MPVVAFPAVDPTAVVELGDRLDGLRDTVYAAVVDIDRAVISIDGRWTGDAANAYTGATNDLAADTSAVAEAIGLAAPVLRAYATAIERAREQYRAAVDLEARALPGLPETQPAVATAQRAQYAAVNEHRGHSEVCRQRLDAITRRLEEIVPPNVADLFSFMFRPTFEFMDEWMDRVAASGGTVDGVPIHLVPPPTVFPVPGQVDSDDMPDGTGTEIRWQLPENGTGYVVYNRDDSALGRGAPAELRRRLGAGELHDQVGTYRTISRMQELADEWARTHPDRTLQYGDVSLNGGVDTNDHSTHEDGRAFDMRPLRNDGGQGALTWQASSYDRDLTKDYLRLVRRRYPTATALFNDPQILGDPEFRGWVRRSGGHDNHVHVVLPDD